MARVIEVERIQALPQTTEGGRIDYSRGVVYGPDLTPSPLGQPAMPVRPSTTTTITTMVA